MRSLLFALLLSFAMPAQAALVDYGSFTADTSAGLDDVPGAVGKQWLAAGDRVGSDRSVLAVVP